MMSAYANSLQKPESFESYVRKFRVICVMHSVQVGSPADLPAFLQKLINDRHLAMDFWGFIGKLTDREGGELTDEQLLALVVEGVANSEVPPDNPNLTRTIEDLRAMLAGVDVHGPGELDPEPFSKSEFPQPLIDRPQRAEARAETRAAHPPNPIPSHASSSHASATPPPPIIPPQLDEALHRLEATNMELKHHLEEIDKRMSRLEPHLDPSVPPVLDSMHAKDANDRTPISRTPIPTTHVRKVHPEEKDLPLKPLKPLKPSAQSRLVLEPAPPPDPPPSDYLPPSKQNEPRIPLDTYSQPQGFDRVGSLLALILILAGASYAGYLYRAPLQKAINTQFQKIHEKIFPAPAVQVAPSAAETTPAEPNPVPKPIQPEAVQPEKVQPEPVQRTPVHPAPSQSAPPAPQHAVIPPPKHTVEPAPSAPAPSDAIPSSELAGAVRVSPSVMESLLYVSRVPAYPDGAKIQGVEGSVVMQAIISSNGTVKRVHIIQGDSRLRGAATEAVYKWRYHPYLINGRPVDVATTITVDFDLDR
jgi:TonB family protein